MGEPHRSAVARGEGHDERVRVAQVVKRREQAGIGTFHPHQLRHTFAHQWLTGGGRKGDLMRLAGWSLRDMLPALRRLSAADERARDTHRRLRPGDRL